ncbi:uncharacterized protein LY89DRAFT_782921 [Mollisia scopiformis]|uniref:Uncharacterized protein n=1 Tax=Mollisia scopiformis TaxID=149040 RepID=A0A194X749_MOLSC|nr:uncharacterized protein LY89DRAFT_782921 [Mollisia scopiformis]KUJ15637.1 hypothetical protein LY89DRAFT_782921 [Mollisia scopiformis]
MDGVPGEEQKNALIRSTVEILASNRPHRYLYPHVAGMKEEKESAGWTTHDHLLRYVIEMIRIGRKRSEEWGNMDNQAAAEFCYECFLLTHQELKRQDDESIIGKALRRAMKARRKKEGTEGKQVGLEPQTKTNLSGRKREAESPLQSAKKEVARVSTSTVEAELAAEETLEVREDTAQDISEPSQESQGSNWMDDLDIGEVSDWDLEGVDNDTTYFIAAVGRSSNPSSREDRGVEERRWGVSSTKSG